MYEYRGKAVANTLEALLISVLDFHGPLSIYKSWVLQTAKDKSLMVKILIWIGYIFGIVHK